MGLIGKVERGCTVPRRGTGQRKGKPQGLRVLQLVKKFDIKVTDNSQILMTGYAIIDFRGGNEDETKVETRGEAEVGVKTGRNKGHPKLHGCIFGTSFGPGCIYDLDPRPPL